MPTIKTTRNKLARITDIEVYDEKGDKVACISIHAREKGKLENRVRMFITSRPKQCFILEDTVNRY
jgi:hypothetical protein